MPPKPQGAAKTAAGGSSVRGRTKQEQDQLQRKSVYRPVLDNPLTVAWPPLPASVRKSILDQLLPILTAPQGSGNKTIAEWRAEEHAARRHKLVGKGKGKGKPQPRSEGEDQEGEGKDAMSIEEGEQREKAMESATTESKEPPTKKPKSLTASSKTKPSESTQTPKIFHFSHLPKKAPRQPVPRPPLLDYLSLGINEVTKALETRIRWGRWELGDSKAMPGGSQLAQPISIAADESLIPTGADSLPPPATEAVVDSKRRTRLRKKSNPTSFSPRVALKLDSIDYSSLSGYEFLVGSIPRPSETGIPSYYIEPTEDQPCPRLLVNSETLRIKRAVKKEKKGETSLSEENRGKEAGLREEATVQGGEQKKQSENVGKNETAQGDTSMVDDDDVKVVQAEEEEENQDREEIPTVPLVDLVFVCKPDINPPSLVAHLPGMVAAANGVQVAIESVIESNTAKRQAKKEKKKGEEMQIDSSAEEQQGKEKKLRPEFGKVQIVPLDQGAERILADALGLRRVAVIGISSTAPGAQELLELVEKHLQPPLAPWLTPHLLHPPPSSSANQASTYVETHIKHLKTSAPLNPRAAHMEKKGKRKLEKEERKRKKKKSGQDQEVYEAQDE